MKHLAKFPVETTSELRKEIKTQLVEVQEIARANHKFITRSGDAERAISDPVVSESGRIGYVDLSRNIAPDVRRLHECGRNLRDSLGRRMTNKRDRFLFKAFKRQKGKIVKGLRKAIARAKRRAAL